MGVVETGRTESQRLRALFGGASPSPRLPELTDESFGDEVLKSALPVIIEFWAETCAPCKLMHPVVRKLAQALAGKAKVVRLDVFANPRTTEALGIKAIPYIMVVRNGDVVLELVGDRSYDDLRAMVKPFVEL
jgi:thioredoxin